MTTDRELLELAAKAAGISIIPYTWNKGSGWDHEGFVIAGSGGAAWDPLEDDADSFGLLVKLGLKISQQSRFGSLILGIGMKRRTKPYRVIEIDSPFIQVPVGVCALSATRRAIVLAAAEIGKAMA